MLALAVIFLFIFTCLIYYLPTIRLFFLIIFLVTGVLIGIKVYIRYLKYGKGIFKSSVFDYQNYDEDTIVTFLKATNTFYKTIKVKSSISKLIIISRFGVLAVYFTQESGLILGNIKDQTLTKKTSIRKEYQIDNFLLPIIKDLPENPSIQKILITRNNLTINVENTKINIIRMKDFFYWYMKCYKKKPLFTNEEIEILAKQLSEM